MKSNIRIVLVNTTHPGNIGAAARAMKNMSLERLYLVEPQGFPSAEATARASGADDVLAKAMVCRSLEEALQGCHLVVGTSARSRTIAWPVENPRQSAARLIDESRHGEVAVVFGREHSGLSNEELEKCHYLVHIPTNQDYSSLNLAAAVQVLAYELMVVTPDKNSGIQDEERELATADEIESFFVHLEQTLIELEFLDSNQPRKLMRRLRRLFNRARPDRTELNILRGILSAAQGRKLYKTLR
jgi:tRNA (cytidine32/uridine32-2'-O)-methyltransferase